MDGYGVQGVSARTYITGHWSHAMDIEYRNRHWIFETEMDIGNWRQKLTLDMRDSNEQWTLETAMDNLYIGHWRQKRTLDIGIGDSNGQRALETETYNGHWRQQ